MHLCLPQLLNDSQTIHDAFQTGYIALRRALRIENNHGRNIEGSFQTKSAQNWGISPCDGYIQTLVQSNLNPKHPTGSYDDIVAVYYWLQVRRKDVTIGGIQALI